MEQEVLKKAYQTLRTKVESLRCPEHQQSPRLKEQGPSGDNMNFTYSFCCEKLKELVEETLK